MQNLEERGLLTHPHTSAGRIPTERGLRLFVDGIMQTAVPNPRERLEIERQIVRNQPIEDALAAASAALSGLSSCAGIVLAPKQELRLKQLSFVPLDSGRALAVLVGADGSVENRIVPLDAGMSPGSLAEVSNFINARLSGLTLDEAQARLRLEIRERKELVDAAAAELVASGLAAWSQDHARRPVLIVRGQANLIDDAAAEDLDRVRLLLGSSRKHKRSRVCSGKRAMRPAAASSSARRTACSLCPAPRSSPRPIAGARGRWSALSA